jgi:hypothetical protein
MFKMSVISHENINYLCQHLNRLIDLSSKHIHTYIKQSSFILPLINRWIIEQLPEAIKLGEKLKKFLEKKKKLHRYIDLIDRNKNITSIGFIQYERPGERRPSGRENLDKILRIKSKMKIQRPFSRSKKKWARNLEFKNF